MADARPLSHNDFKVPLAKAVLIEALTAAAKAACRMSARIGQPTLRVEGRAKVTGAARYAAEQTLPDLHHAVIVPATVAAGRITRLDAADALTLPGVLAVLDHRDAPRLAPVKIFPFGPAGEGWMPLQTDRVAYAGQAVALVVARTPEIAAHAASLVRVGVCGRTHRAL